MINHNDVDNKTLLRKIRSGELIFGGNKKLKSYGRLNCISGKRMKRENRVFLSSELEALNNGYRPCGHCMLAKYKIYKKLQ